ncbi:unnamed protein product [Moneuplotes crassus]|uniref:Golgin subfamily A member 7/ERF4 domain-containing protein n=1 Tax=Euplotes crassus TaxID=5936 RepID=A0AAD2D8R2_EUPCR|nr:unnamed protein product [Moneuplotes crassus]
MQKSSLAALPQKAKAYTHIVSLVPDSLPFITGIAPSYTAEYDYKEMGDYLTQEEFNYILEKINSILFTYWPCCMCYYGLGLIFGILTLGLTCICPYLIIREAQGHLDDTIQMLNAQICKPKGLTLEYRSQCCYRSSIELFATAKESMDAVI